MVSPMSDEGTRLTLIVPAFNESRRLSERASKFEEAVLSGVLCPRTTELIVVDDGSSDQTGLRAEQLFASTFPHLRVLRLHENCGKGAAVRLGVAAASSPITAFMDADMAVELADLPRLVKAIGPADIAIGSRAHNESVVVTDGMHRRFMGWTFNSMVEAFTRLPYRDTQCGFKAYRTPIARLLFHLMSVDGFAFDVEVLSLARMLKMEIAEVAVRWTEIGQSTVRCLIDPIVMTRDLFSVSKRRHWPNLPTLAVTPCRGERRRSPSRIVAELHRALGSNTPIVIGSGGKFLVLLPLVDPIEVQSIATKLRHLPVRLSVRERSLSFKELLELVPFRWVDGEHDGFIVASSTEACELVTVRPVDGWASLRTSNHTFEAQGLRSTLRVP
jgi:dolichyl-phosphate beta-glucosyltransferase